VSATDLHRTIEAVWRIESAHVIAGLTRLTRDVGLAEDLAQEALLAALEQWPQSGVPENPGNGRAFFFVSRDVLFWVSLIEFPSPWFA